MACGDVHVVYYFFLGYAVNEIDEIWQQISRG